MSEKNGLKIIQEALAEGRNILLEYEAKTLCEIFGIPTTRFKVAKNEFEAVKYAKEIGFPVVLKIVSPDITHKSDFGGVILNVKNEEKVKESYLRVIENVKKQKPNIKILGVLVEEMVKPSTEVIVGLIRDPQFGPTVMFGLGGIFVEVLKDVSFRVCPVTKTDAEEMIKEIKGYQILKGYRNLPPVNLETLTNIILGVCKIGETYPEIQEIDLNPIIVYRDNAKAVDVRIVLRKNSS
jgi:acetyl-CoA synthetase (ADP-forming)